MNIQRRSFLRLGAGLIAASELPRAALAKSAPLPPIKLRQIEICAGASKPFGAVHVSDTHIVRADSRDNARKITLAARRSGHMKWGEHYLDEAIRAAESAGEMLIHTGDLIDFVSAANLEMAERHFAGHDWFASSGNHEFSQYVGEAKEDDAYRRVSYNRVQAAYPNDLTFASRVVNGVNFVAIDDVYYNVTEAQHALFEKEVAKGLPIVILCHVPFYTPRHHDEELKRSRGVCSYETGVPDEKIATWRAPSRPFGKGEEWRDRRVQQRADAPTKEFIKYIKAQPLLKAILCGHCHNFWEERFSPTAVQYVCSATYMGDGYRIRFT
jgi:hypothetical protein